MDGEIKVSTASSVYAKEMTHIDDQITKHQFNAQEIKGSGAAQCKAYDVFSKLDLLFASIRTLYKNSAEMIDSIIEEFGNIDKAISENINSK